MKDDSVGISISIRIIVCQIVTTVIDIVPTATTKYKILSLLLANHMH
jgi:hypothetical protein